MKRFFIIRWIENIRGFIKIARNPQAAHWLKVVEDVMKFANEANQNKVPIMTQLRAINYGKPDVLPNPLDIVSLWASVGDANPIKRIGQLKEQISGLRTLLAECRSKLNIEEDENLIVNINLFLTITE